MVLGAALLLSVLFVILLPTHLCCGVQDEVYNVMMLEPRTMEQAVSERCLRVVLDFLGVVQVGQWLLLLLLQGGAEGVHAVLCVSRNPTAKKSRDP